VAGRRERERLGFTAGVPASSSTSWATSSALAAASSAAPSACASASATWPAGPRGLPIFRKTAVTRPVRSPR
jgi:hypothetical protein